MLPKKRIQLSIDEYKLRSKHRDGLCTQCYSWVANPHLKDSDDPVGSLCPECENETVVSMKKARELGLIEVK